MMPFTPMNEDFDRVIHNIEEGDPEVDSPASEGGIGADTPDLGETGEALKQEGILDETIAEEETKPA